MSNTYPLPLAQANLVRWLDKRVPLTAGDVTLSIEERSKLITMIYNGSIPIFIRKDCEDSYSLIVDEGKGSIEDFYVLEANVCGDNICQVMEDNSIRFSQWKMA
jgi:hypothetical protein